MTTRLPDDIAIPDESETRQCVQNALCCAGDFTWRIEIFNANQPQTPRFAGLQLTARGGNQRAEMQRASRGGSEAERGAGARRWGRRVGGIGVAALPTRPPPWESGLVLDARARGR